MTFREEAILKLDVEGEPRRVVSLVPSLTESMFDLGLGDRLVGITDFCVHPAEKVATLPRVGGTKNPSVSQILSLQPDLVLVNREENTQASYDSLVEAGLRVWVTAPDTVPEAIGVLWELVRAFHHSSAAPMLQTLEKALTWAETAAKEKESLRYFCPIWYGSSGEKPWFMTFNRNTYAHDLLNRIGGINAFSERDRLYPLQADLGIGNPADPEDRDTRYPRVTPGEVNQADPEVILLPDEPFAFDEKHRVEISRLLAETPAVRAGRVYLVDGSLITWHGTRLGMALQELPRYFAG